MTIEKAVELLNLSTRTIPMTEEENNLLLQLVSKWLVQHGEAWVKSNPLLECEWQRQRAELSREPNGRTSCDMVPLRGNPPTVLKQ